jgi:hypothetical protein
MWKEAKEPNGAGVGVGSRRCRAHLGVWGTLAKEACARWGTIGVIPFKLIWGTAKESCVCGMEAIGGERGRNEAADLSGHIFTGGVHSVAHGRAAEDVIECVSINEVAPSATHVCRSASDCGPYEPVSSCELACGREQGEEQQLGVTGPAYTLEEGDKLGSVRLYDALLAS